MKSNFILMSEYNLLLNRNILEAISGLDSEELAKDRGAFFGSILGTLNHILVGDIIWLKRIAKHPMNLSSLEELHDIPQPSSLDQILYQDFKTLKKEREKIDIIINNFISEISDEQISSTLNYKNSKAKPFSKNLGYIIQHLFNHQTHHRGQVSTLLSQIGIDIGATDFLMVIPNE